MEKTNPKCIRCNKILTKTVCYVENAGLCTINFPMISEHYEKSFHAYICDSCVSDLYSKNNIMKI